jgi:hypothetical protein
MKTLNREVAQSSILSTTKKLFLAFLSGKAESHCMYLGTNVTQA